MDVGICIPYLVIPSGYIEDVYLTCCVTRYKVVPPSYNTFDSDWDYYGYTEIEWGIESAYVENNYNKEYLDLDIVLENIDEKQVELLLLEKIGSNEYEI